MLRYNKVILKKHGFTIVELLITIVIIGVLAAITIVSYSSIYNKAIAASLQSDLDNDSKLLKMYNAEYGYYPTTLDSGNCPLTPIPDAKYCLKASTDTHLAYTGGGQKFAVAAAKGGQNYRATEKRIPYSLDPDWQIIGNQTWARANINVGTMINGATEQTNNGGANIVEKYCYNDDGANCAIYGGLYQWNEVMQYATTEGAQGICPAESHVPSDNDWKILEMHLGMTQAQVDAEDWRGTDQGTRLKFGGSSGLNMILAGYRKADSVSFSYLRWNGFLWSSSESDSDAWGRYLTSSDTSVGRFTYGKTGGFSVRCLGD